MTDVIFENSVAARRANEFFDSFADLVELFGGGQRCDTRPECAFGNFTKLGAVGQNLRVDAGGLATRHDHGDCAIAVPAIRGFGTAVDRDDVAGRKHAVSRNAVHNLVIHARANGVTVARHQFEV